MGRRKEPLELQAAKGFPGRRRKRVEREIDAAAKAADSEPVTGDDPFTVPRVFQVAPAHYRRAIELWRQLADVLRVGGRRRPGYRAALTRYCIWSQIHEGAAESLRRDCKPGQYTQEWTPVNGSTRIVPHPSLKIMSDAEPILRALEGEFGFTPRADSDLMRVESFNRAQMPLFDAPAAPVSRPTGPTLDPIDLMSSTDSVPPGLPN